MLSVAVEVWGYLEGQGDLVSGSITLITHIVTLVILITNLLKLLSPHDPPSKEYPP